MTFPLKALTAAVLLAGLPAAAHAMPYSQLVIFGDSLSDSGQFPDSGGPAFPNGGNRFTNRTGPNFNSTEYFAAVSTQRLGAHLGLQALPSTPYLLQPVTGNPDGTNYAVGGYRTGQILSSITTTSETIVPVGQPGAGTVLRSRSGYLAEFGRADANALYYINGGGNDVLQGFITDQTSAAVAAKNLVDGVVALQRAGARTIIVSDLPDVGMTPFGLEPQPGFPSGMRAFFSNGASLFNDALATQLSALGGNVIRLNYRGLLSEVQADLVAFGFDPLVAQTDVCFSGSGCTADPTWGLGGISPNPNKLLFNDGVHPTAAVQQITADYTYSILSAPWQVSLLPEMAMASLNGHQQQLRSEWQADRGAWQAVGQWRSFVAASGQRQQFQEGAAVASGDSHGLGLNLGGSYRLDDSWRLGLALGLQEQSLEAGEADSEYDLSSYLLSAFAQYQNGRVWADTSLSLGHLDYGDLNRQFALGIAERSEKGDTDGQLWALSGRLGYDLANAGTGWRVSPFISADYARVDVDGYRERGMSSTALNYDDQQRDSMRLGLGLQMNYQLSPATQVFAEVARERELEDDPRQLRMGLNSVAGNRFELQGHTPASGQTLAGLGVSHALSSELQLRAAYQFRGTTDRQHGVNLSLNWDF
ncbi:autotransporter domain-containing protein [Pseudomonas sp. LPB0260]|uniref:autotransporter domain-containing protein n=1 Tax=Pseudomonas sp. LPB0260 TaxID=2614442 RepID=UPI0015C1C8D8|nr:autotransporter domain-containing protein [Pseudomonas sp. LPB0260]QLC73457.1 autotransporter domain-containing protein [Pseudomonas sp. LPB0260]QLC76231.1 autotransporter domain-containing protein [Pseudomonas sp. LPB0260]